MRLLLASWAVPAQSPALLRFTVRHRQVTCGLGVVAFW